MNSETRHLIAQRYIGIAHDEQYVDWAVSCLEAGIDSKNIRILASLQKPFYSVEVEDYFNRSLKDLDWNFPEPKSCVTQYARFIAQEILRGQIAPVEGCHKIYDAVIFLDYPREMSAWVYLDDEIRPEPFQYLTGKELDDAIIEEARKFVDETSVVI